MVVLGNLECLGVVKKEARLVLSKVFTSVYITKQRDDGVARSALDIGLTVAVLAKLESMVQKWTFVENEKRVDVGDARGSSIRQQHLQCGRGTAAMGEKGEFVHGVLGEVTDRASGQESKHEL